jgi:hypothetical protein
MHFGSTLCRKHKRIGPPGKPASRFRNSRSQSLGSPNRANAERDSSTARPDRKSGRYDFREKEIPGRYPQNDSGSCGARFPGRFQREHTRCYLISEYKAISIYLPSHSNGFSSARSSEIVRMKDGDFVEGYFLLFAMAMAFAMRDAMKFWKFSSVAGSV